MNSIEDLSDIESSLGALLVAIRSDASASLVRSELRQARDEIYADLLAHGESVQDDWITFVITPGKTAVFAVFADPFLVYAFQCDPARLISEASRRSMDDVQDWLHHLANEYGKGSADISIPRSLAEFWMNDC